jgi:hypothetical protein
MNRIFLRVGSSAHFMSNLLNVYFRYNVDGTPIRKKTNVDGNPDDHILKTKKFTLFPRGNRWRAL